MSSSFARQASAIALVLIIAGCQSGGCSGCAGCGIEQIPGGFPLERRVENAGQIRLTSYGVQFVEDNLGTIISTFLPDGLTFPIPHGQMDFAGMPAEICPAGNCTVELELTDVTLEPRAPNVLAARLRMIVRTHDLTLAVDTGIPCDCSCDWDGCDCSTEAECYADVDTTWEAPEDVGIDVDIVFATDPHTGYTRVDVPEPELGDDLAGGDFEMGSAGGCFLELVCDVANAGFVKDLIVPLIVGQIGSQLSEPIQEQLCRACEQDAECPNGNGVASSCNGGTCEYDDGDCVPILLGSEGRADLGQLLASVTPGLSGQMQFAFASGGDGVAETGLNLSMFGGLDSLAHNPCVPEWPAPEMPEIPIATSLRADTAPGDDLSMLNIGIAEDYLNWAAYGVYDSGMLCIGAGPRMSQALSTGLFSLVFPSLAEAVFPADKAPVALQLKPQGPPFIDVGAGTEDDPLLQIFLGDLQIDFYAFIEDRYTRFMTVKLDLGISLGIELGPDGILPLLDEQDITVDNVVVENSELLQESPEDIAAVFSDLIGIAMGTFLGSLEPTPIPNLMGFELDVPENGITRVTELDSDFLAIFANLSFAPEQARLEVDTNAELVELEVDPTAYDLVPDWRERLPVARVLFESSADGSPVQYSVRVDGSAWSRWTSEPDRMLRSRSFLLQGDHTIEVRSRLADQPLTADRTPALLPFTIDTRPPRLKLERTVDRIVAKATDLVSEPDRIEYSARIGIGIGDDEWSAWSSRSSWSVAAPIAIEVRARDAARNVQHATIDASGIIRGQPSPTNPTGCECGSVGAPLGGWPSALVGLGGLSLLGLALRRRVRGVRTLLGAFPFVLFASGCDCAGGTRGDDLPDAGSACDPACGAGEACCETSRECIEAPDYDCEPGFACADPSAFDPETCTWAADCECVALPPVDPGFIGSYTDFAVDSDGTIWVSGYEEGVSSDDPYGDLVVGRWQEDGVGWVIVDGLPADGEIVGDPSGWRGGIRDPGPDVGRYTSISIGPDNSPRVAYYDATSRDLKLALRDDGTWVVRVVDEDGDSGRFASLVTLPNGAPAIAYWATVPDPDVPGGFVGRAMAAEAEDPSATSWIRTVLHEVAVPCRPWYCDAGQQCGADGLCFSPTDDCNPGCAQGSACSAGECATVLSAAYIEDWPEGTGLFASLAVGPDGLAGVVYYDRTGGDLWRSRHDGTAWQAAERLDGMVGELDTGDVGLSSTLAIDDDGDWHVAYVDGWTETLYYLGVESGVREEADNGIREDGLHLVGDDADIAVAEDGTVTIVYQDSTAGTLELSTRAPSGEWTRQTLDDAGTSGFFASHVGDRQVGCYFRDMQASPPTDGVRIFELP